MILFIVFLPLAAAIIAGLGQRAIGAPASKLLTTGALFVAAMLAGMALHRALPAKS